MISSVIVLVSIFMACLFTFCYFRSARFRDEVEHPKHQFMEQLAQYESVEEIDRER